jgi:proteasome accessory factor B
MKAAREQPELSFALDEALALYLGRRFFEPLAGTYFWEAAQSAFRKIQACLGKSALRYLQNMAGSLYQTAIGASDYSAKAELIDQLMRGIEETKATHIVYLSLQATELVTYEVCPLGLAFHKGSLYLVANSRDHGELRHFKVDRIEEAEVGPFPFERPADFNLAEHLANSFGIFHGDGDVAVKVRFLPAVARYVQESKWHDSQQLSPQKDGSVLAEFRLSSVEEIKHWLLGFGGKAVVLEPLELRQQIAAELGEMLANYKEPPSVRVQRP